MRNFLKYFLEVIVAAKYRALGCEIGKRPKISRSARIDLTHPKGIKIGSHVLISSNATILAHDFVNQKHLTTIIGSNVFIGMNSVIMAGCTVGDNVIIGANSVVTKNIPPYSIVAGVPANLLRKDKNISTYGIIKRIKDVD